MALGDPYATRAELKTYLGISDSTDDTALDDALSTASRAVEKYTNRQFNLASSATARVYYVERLDLLAVEDFATTTGLVVATDEGDDGTYETTWATTDYQLLPLNGVVDGETGWPYWRIKAVGTHLFPVVSLRPAVQVTAKWGWSAVPAGVKQATKILAADIFKLATAPFGVAGYGEYGPVRVRDNPVACRLLGPYRRDPIMVGG